MNQHRCLNISATKGFTLVEVMLAVAVLAIGIGAIVGTIFNMHTLRKSTDSMRQARQVIDLVYNTIQATNWDDLNDRSKPDAYLTWARLPDPEGDGLDNDEASLGDAPTLPLEAGSSDPRQRRLLPLRSGLEDLRVYVEYYRAQTATDSFGGVMKDSDNSNKECVGGLLDGVLVRTPSAAGEIWQIDATAAADRVQNPLSGRYLVERVGTGTGAINRIPSVGILGGNAPILLPAEQSISSNTGVRIGDNDPVAVRITATWIDRTLLAPAGEAPRRQALTILTGKKR